MPQKFYFRFLWSHFVPMSFFGNFSLALLAGSLFSFDTIKAKTDEIVDSYSKKSDNEFLEDLGAQLFNQGANVLSGCKYECPSNRKKIPNKKHEATPNGCGAYGFKLYLDHLPGIEKCCDQHDICYGTCNKKKQYCDSAFGSCLTKYCKNFKKRKCFTDERCVFHINTIT